MSRMVTVLSDVRDIERAIARLDDGALEHGGRQRATVTTMRGRC